MQRCPQCDANNAERNNFCGSCGELIRIDPGFAKKVRHVMAEDWKARRTRYFAQCMVVLAVGGFLGYETIIKLIAGAVQKVTPVVQAQLESVVQAQLASNVQRNLKAELPAVAIQASQQVATRARQEFEDGYVQAARQEAEKIKPDFRARLATIQAEEETKVRAEYQQARNNIQLVPSGATSWTGTAITPTLPFSGAPPTLTGLENATYSPAADLLKWPIGSTTLTLSVTSTPVQSSASGAICFSDKGLMGSFDANGSCKAYVITTPLSSTANFITTTQ
jgi:hypothetical protein